MKLSDLAVNTFVPSLTRVGAIARLPGVRSSATYVGLNAFPVVDGKVVRDFRYTGVFASLDGRFFTQDRATVVAGRLPHEDARTELALSPKVATRFGVRVGDRINYRFEATRSKRVDDTTFRIVGIVKLPPVVVDENDIIEGAVLPPAATRADIDALAYSWQGIRLVDGAQGISKFLETLRTNPTVNSLPPVTQRYDETRVQAQRSIRPEAVALALFGLAAAVAVLALGGLATARLSRRWSTERLALRALGMTHRQRASVFGLDSALAVTVGMVLAIVLAILLSPLWPIGAVREIAPDAHLHADLTVLLCAGGLLASALLAISAVWALRGADDRRIAGRGRVSVVVAGATGLGVSLPGVLGAHFALDRDDERSVPARGTLFAGGAATIAVIAALVFGASLHSLVTNPSRYGWNWDRILMAEAGYGSLEPSVMQRLVNREPTITGWSLLAFRAVTINGASVPAIGLDRRKRRVEPTRRSGRAVSDDHEIALGAITLEQLGRHVGDRVLVAAGGRAAEFTIVGTVVLPSIGAGGADHTSLGRGALLSYDALAMLTAPGASCLSSSAALCPQAVALDVAPNTNSDAALRRIAAANPDGTVGGTYEQPVSRAADIRNYDQMGSLPVALAALLAAAAATAFLLTVLATTRARRRDLAILRTLGLTTPQIRKTMIAQTLITVFAALIVGVPLGILAGRLTWIRFAGDIGLITTPTVPILLVLAIIAAAGVTCSAFALIPAAVATRTPAARVLHTE